MATWAEKTCVQYLKVHDHIIILTSRAAEALESICNAMTIWTFVDFIQFTAENIQERLNSGRPELILWRTLDYKPKSRLYLLEIHIHKFKQLYDMFVRSTDDQHDENVARFSSISLT
jgi:hypothetical protein